MSTLLILVLNQEGNSFMSEISLVWTFAIYHLYRLPAATVSVCK